MRPNDPIVRLIMLYYEAARLQWAIADMLVEADRKGEADRARRLIRIHLAAHRRVDRYEKAVTQAQGTAKWPH